MWVGKYVAVPQPQWSVPVPYLIGLWYRKVAETLKMRNLDLSQMGCFIYHHDRNFQEILNLLVPCLYHAI